ncbi:hypothetical protein QQF64_034892 [Cirrhinus molitorella]|uniref:MHC class I antigen n=1 Tax=Cirrhinus molitorella TaxID=172907 RepID=A0ABR3NEA9_9TELE
MTISHQWEQVCTHKHMHAGPGVTALRRSHWRDHTSGGRNAGAFHLDEGMKDEGVTRGGRGQWRTDACSFRREDVRDLPEPTVCV